MVSGLREHDLCLLVALRVPCLNLPIEEVAKVLIAVLLNSGVRRGVSA